MSTRNQTETLFGQPSPFSLVQLPLSQDVLLCYQYYSQFIPKTKPDSQTQIIKKLVEDLKFIWQCCASLTTISEKSIYVTKLDD